MAFKGLLVGASVSFGLGIAASSGMATTLPESYPLSAAVAGPTLLDPQLAKWLQLHAEQLPPADLDAAGFKALLARQDALSSLYLKLARGSNDAELPTTMPPSPTVGPLATAPAAATTTPASPPDFSRSLIDQAFTLISSDRDPAHPSVLNHPLLPFLYLEILKSPSLSPAERAQTQLRFNQVAAGSCASKHSVYEEINLANLTNLPDDGLRELLARLDVYRSKSFKRSALRRFAGLLPEARQNAVADQILASAQPYPEVIRAVPWLNSLAEKTGKTGETHEPEASFAKARLLAARKSCGLAKDLMLSTLRTIKGLTSLNDAVNTGKAIEGCYRAQDRNQRAAFWRLITKQMDRTYGIDGWAESLLRLGFIDWSHNSFDEATATFKEVIARTEGKIRKYEARALYALARIAENEGDVERAASLYQDYMSRFPEQENAEEAMMAAVLLRAGKGEWLAISTQLEAMIQAQTMLRLDDRSVGALSFALFWAGRAYLEQNRVAEATELWRRLASEYYSTYYGALGHYLLEKTQGRSLALQPARSPGFRMQTLRDAFSLPDQQKILRIEALMRLGMKNSAICELEELDVADGKPEKILVKALVMHASGRWLDAVKAYDSIPRSFRNSLPVGFERILFPQRFGVEVRALALKAKVDPDLVLAIIRQESVFNPLARSPVGAMGLMQLMPQTARLEMKHIESAYMPEAEQHVIHQHLGNPLGLLLAETNLKIGVHHVRSLLEKYLSPVYVLSAYNASPAAAQRWMTTLPTKDPLVFIERIPYKETRAYVKLVLRNYFYYKRWYGNTQDPLQHLETVTSPLLALLNVRTQPAPRSSPVQTPVQPVMESAAESSAALPTESSVGAVRGPPAGTPVRDDSVDK